MHFTMTSQEMDIFKRRDVDVKLKNNLIFENIAVNEKHVSSKCRQSH